MPHPQASALISPHTTRVQAILKGVGDLYPYEPNFLEVFGAQMAYLDEGPKDAPVLLCLHGNPTWSFFYRSLVEAHKHHMRVVVPDHVGMGLSEQPQDYPYDLEHRIAAIEQLVEKLDLKRITLVVHDWGGAIGMGLAGRHPERFERFVISNTAAFPGGQAHSLIRVARLPGLNGLLMGKLGLFEKITVKHATERDLAPAIQKAYLAPFGNLRERIAVRSFVRDIPLRRSHKSYATLEQVDANLAHLKHIPTLLLWGEKDWVFTPEFRKRFEERFPQAETVAFEDVGHLLWEDEPERCLAAVQEFLDRHPLS
ncbi:MAG: pimeloyl-ACP methyl ester carboxylesterase [Glaciecola sp.]